MVVSLITGYFRVTAPTQDDMHRCSEQRIENGYQTALPAAGVVNQQVFFNGYLTTVLLTSLTLCLMVHSYRMRRERLRFFVRLGIPGPSPHLIMGNGDLMRNRSLVAIEVMDHWQRLYGQLYGYFIGPKPYVVVSHLDHIHQVLVKEFHNFVNRPSLGMNLRPLTDTLVYLRDQRWKDVRRVISPTFSGRQMRHISSIVNCCVDILIQVVDDQQHGDIEFHGLFQGLTCQVICKTALNSNVECQRDPQNHFLDALRLFFKSGTSRIIDIAIYFPTVKRLMSCLSPCGQFTQSIIDKVQQAIHQHRQNRQQGLEDDKKRHIDMLTLLLESAEASGDDSTNPLDAPRRLDPHGRIHYLLSDEEIVANAWVFLLGGFETTANTLTYCCYLLAKHPHIQQRVYEEIRQHVQIGQDLEFDVLGQLTYLDQVISETLRMYPPVVLMITREVSNDTQIGDYQLPAGINIQIPVWQIHHNPDVWPDPYSFDPDRFLPEAKKDRHPMAWIPFGAGPRGCIGLRFALLETKVALAKILTKYRLVPCQRTEETLTLRVPTVTLNPSENGVWLAVEPR